MLVTLVYNINKNINSIKSGDVAKEKGDTWNTMGSKGSK
jgi:hypothetical protein